MLSELDLPGLSSKHELDFLARMAQSAPQRGHVVELGAYAGRSTAALCRAVGDKRVLSIDNWSMQHHGAISEKAFRENLNKLGYSPTIVNGDSRKARPDIAVDGVAMVFFDSDHSGVTLTAEIDAWLPLLRSRGFVVFHDYGDPRFAAVTQVVESKFSAVHWSCLGKAGTMLALERNV